MSAKSQALRIRLKSGIHFIASIFLQVIQAFSKRPYDDNITSLLRFMRNVDEHIADARIPESARQHVGIPAEYFLREDRFLILPMLVHRILRKQAKNVAEIGGNADKWVERPSLKRFFFKCASAKS